MSHQDISAAMDEIIRAAERATGLTREELIAASERITAPPLRSELVLDPRRLGRRNMLSAGCPERHIRNVCDSDPVECEALSAVRDFIAGPLDLLVLSGGVGTRKSGSACWSLSQSAEGVYTKAPNLLALAIEDKAAYLRLSRAKHVVFDDLGSERHDQGGEWVKTFNSLFDDWYGNCAKVILTCNLSADDFKSRYGERVADRIREAGRFVVVSGASVRGKR